MPYSRKARLARKPRTHLLLAMAYLLALSGPALATTAVSHGESQSVNPARYFASPATELTARATIKQRFDALETSNSMLDIETDFHTLEALFGECLDHYAYHELIAAQNASDRVASASSNDVEDLCGDIADTAKGLVRTAPTDARWVQPLTGDTHFDIRSEWTGRKFHSTTNMDTDELIDFVDELNAWVARIKSDRA